MVRRVGCGDDGRMAGRAWIWSGAAVTAVAVAALAAYFMVVGLDQADKLASVVGGLSALAGLVLAAFGLAGAPGTAARGRRTISQEATASGRSQVSQTGGSRTPRGAAAEAGPSGVQQRAEASEESSITQVGGDHVPPAAP